MEPDLKKEKTLTEYDNLIKDIRYNSNLFIQLSEEAGTGTKKLALDCRKMSSQLTKQLKAFRELSIINDKLK